MATILRSRFWNYCFTFIVISTRITCDFASEEEQESPTSFYHQKTAVAPPPASRPKIKFIPNDFDLYDYLDVDLYYLIPVDHNKKPPSWNGVSTATNHHQAQNSHHQPCDHGTHSNQVEKPVIFPSHLTYSYDYYEDPDPPGWSSPGWPSEPAPPPPPPPAPTPGWSWPAAPPVTPGWSWPAAPPPAPPPPTPGWGWQAPAPTPGWPAAGWAWPAEPEPPKPEKVKEKSKSKNKGKAKDKSKSKAKEKAKGEKEKPDKGKEKVKEVEIKEKIKYVYVKEKEEKDKDKDKGDKGEKHKDKDKDKDKKEKSKPKKKFAAFMKDVWNKFVDVLKFEKYADFDVTGERRLRSENGKNDTEKGQSVLDTLYIPVSIALRWASAYPKVSNGTE